MKYRITIEEEKQSDSQYDRWGEIYKQELPELDVAGLVLTINQGLAMQFTKAQKSQDIEISENLKDYL